MREKVFFAMKDFMISLWIFFPNFLSFQSDSLVDVVNQLKAAASLKAITDPIDRNKYWLDGYIRGTMTSNAIATILWCDDLLYFPHFSSLDCNDFVVLLFIPLDKKGDSAEDYLGRIKTAVAEKTAELRLTQAGQKYLADMDTYFSEVSEKIVSIKLESDADDKTRAINSLVRWLNNFKEQGTNLRRKIGIGFIGLDFQLIVRPIG